MAGKQQTRPSIVLADDEPSVRRVLARFLDGVDVAVVEAGSGKEVLAILAESIPDLVVLDIEMPGMSGLDVCRAIRARSETAGVPIIVVTGLAGANDLAAILEAGATDYMSKPVRMQEFLSRVRNQLALQDARRQMERLRLEREVESTQRLRQAFERYLSPSVVEQVLASGESGGARLLSEHVRCDAVIMFADLRGFTPMTAALDPAIVVGMLNQFFTLLVRVAHRYQATTISMAGDSLMLAFGVPYPIGKAAPRALRTAERMLESFPKLADQWLKQHGVQTGLGIGINFGEVIAGNVGAPSYMSYTVIGDTVNVAARLKDRARAGEILYTESFAMQLERPMPRAILIDGVMLKGKLKPLRIFCVPAIQRVDVVIAPGDITQIGI